MLSFVSEMQRLTDQHQTNRLMVATVNQVSKEHEQQSALAEETVVLSNMQMISDALESQDIDDENKFCSVCNLSLFLRIKTSTDQRQTSQLMRPTIKQTFKENDQSSASDTGTVFTSNMKTTSDALKGQDTNVTQDFSSSFDNNFSDAENVSYSVCNFFSDANFN